MKEKSKKWLAGVLAWVGIMVQLMAAGMSDGGVGEGWVFLVAVAGLGMLTGGVILYNKVTGGYIEDIWEGGNEG